MKYLHLLKKYTMKQQPVRRLDLKKKTIARLNDNDAQVAQGGTISIIVATTGCATFGCVPNLTNGCMTDFTRTIRPPSGP
jgi:hypothetical protein